MRRVLVFYGYFEPWNRTENPWDQDLYKKEFLLEVLNDLIDDVKIAKDMDSLKRYLDGKGKNCKNYIFPTLEWDVEALFYTDIKSLFGVGVEPHLFKKLLSKTRFFEYLEEINCLKYAPRIYSKSSDRDSDQLVVVKHQFMSSSGGVTKKLLRDVHDWEFDDYSVQEYIYGMEEYDAVFVFDKGRITLGFAYLCGFDKDEYIKFQDDIKFASYKKVIFDDKINKIFEEILEPFCFTGTCCFDFKMVDDEVRIFEINPRVDGALTSMWNKDDLALVIRHLITNYDREPGEHF
jgi:predicted ATP-grasp superfamily ATP-dependent carboligase